jgi:hypothetical protein
LFSHDKKWLPKVTRLQRAKLTVTAENLFLRENPYLSRKEERMNAASYSNQRRKTADVEVSRHLHFSRELPDVKNSLIFRGIFLTPVEESIKPALRSFSRDHRMIRQVKSIHNTR